MIFAGVDSILPSALGSVSNAVILTWQCADRCFLHYFDWKRKRGMGQKRNCGDENGGQECLQSHFQPHFQSHPPIPEGGSHVDG